MTPRLPLAALAAVFTLLTSTLHAQVPQLLNYQGRVAVGTVNFDGSGQFKFAFVNAAGATAYWTNDGTHLDGSQPTTAVTIPVTKGLYSVLLGDTSLGMAAIPVSAFTNSDVRLRIWFNDGPHGFQLLTPDQRLTSTAYALQAGGLQNVPVAATAPVSDQFLKYNGTAWAPGSLGTVPISQGGTGSTTQSFLDLTNAQTIGGAKSFTSPVTAPSFNGSLIGNATSASSLIGVLPVASGGTGSAVQNFVDLTTNQTIAGAKNFVGGVTSINPSGIGVLGSSSTAPGIFGINTGTLGSNQPGVTGLSTYGDGVSGVSYSADGAAVRGVGISGKGVDGKSDSNDAIFGMSRSGSGVHGESLNADGVFGISHGGIGGIGVHGKDDIVNGVGVLGESERGIGVHGISVDDTGVEADSVNGTGLEADSVNGTGVDAESDNGVGVSGASETGTGVVGRTASPTNSAIYAENTGGGGGLGVRTNGLNNSAIYAENTGGGGGLGVKTNGLNNSAIYAENTGGGGGLGAKTNGANNTAVYGENTGGGYAGGFQGKIFVNGTASVSGNLSVGGNLSKASGSFKIDHPLDPANKYLYHSFVESPDMMNIYNGNVTTDAKGRATVTLPDYFKALNCEYRYQLTVIGQFAQAIVASEIKDNCFTIKTSKNRVKVSWQVTGIRQDAYALAHRIPTTEDKAGPERGAYLHPELFGESEEKRIGRVQQPQTNTTAESSILSRGVSGRP